ncbi:MAG: GNAT family N-acetyltransferase [Promethearchaeati archaeon]
MPESRDNLKQKRIRNFFLSFDAACTEENVQEKAEKEGLTYIQMKLPVEKITEEFENEIKKKVEKSFLGAKIREAKEEDLETVMNIHNRAWMTANEPFRPIELESLKKIHEYPETEILIAKVYGNDGGFIILDREGENNEIGVIAGLGVLPNLQRKGLGTVLGMSAWNYFKKKDVTELRCEVYKDNSVSYGFIKSLGFEEYDKKTYTKDDFLLD